MMDFYPIALFMIAIIIIALVFVGVIPTITIVMEEAECVELCDEKGMMRLSSYNGYCYCKEIPENVFKMGDEK